ncbi:helix-turn-helix transcriptional regulator [Desulfovibrio sp. SGI.169]|uniref:helix-turn-helix transcriptional regulator n=1 Tax=Desulfovibrio sp. SGI.169 TaxID=3420561 RepID=UPI003D053F2B
MSQHIPVLPETGFMRLSDVLKFIPIKKTRWYKGVNSGEFPRPIAFSSRVKVYRAEDIRALIERMGSQATKGAE